MILDLSKEKWRESDSQGQGDPLFDSKIDSITSGLLDYPKSPCYSDHLLD